MNKSNMKYLIGAVIGAMVVAGATVYAATVPVNGLLFVERVNGINKYYDRDANVICYEDDNGVYGIAISCLKNN